MDRVFKALADSSRRKLLDHLRQKNGQKLNDLCAELEMSRQAVSKHLRILEDAKLMVIVWRGREKFHFLNPVPIHEISTRWINKYENQRLDAISELKKALEKEEHER